MPSLGNEIWTRSPKRKTGAAAVLSADVVTSDGVSSLTSLSAIDPSLPSWLAYRIGLQTLNLRRQRLTAIPNEVGELRALRQKHK